MGVDRLSLTRRPGELPSSAWGSPSGGTASTMPSGAGSNIPEAFRMTGSQTSKDRFEAQQEQVEATKARIEASRQEQREFMQANFERNQAENKRLASEQQRAKDRIRQIRDERSRLMKDPNFYAQELRKLNAEEWQCRQTDALNGMYMDNGYRNMFSSALSQTYLV